MLLCWYFLAVLLFVVLLINVKFVATEGLLIIAVAGLLLRGVALELTGGGGAGVVDEMRFIFLLAKPILN